MAQLVRPNVHIVNVHALGGLEMMRAAVEAAERARGRARHRAAAHLRGHAAHEHRARGSQRARVPRRSRRERDSSRRARARRGLCRRRLQRARGSRPQALLRRRFSDADARHSSDRQRARRSEARHDAGRRPSRPAPIISSSDVRSSKRPIRSPPPKRFSRRCRYERERNRARPANALAQRGALLEGHFRLSSGRHSDRFVQKFRILEDPALLEPVARAIAERFRAVEPTVVVSAAVGGIVLAYEVARQLGTKAIFVEKENGVPTLRRGFTLEPDDRALLVEDVVTTGLSVRETIDVVRALRRQVVGHRRHRGLRGAKPISGCRRTCCSICRCARTTQPSVRSAAPASR